LGSPGRNGLESIGSDPRPLTRTRARVRVAAARDVVRPLPATAARGGGADSFATVRGCQRHLPRRPPSFEHRRRARFMSRASAELVGGISSSVAGVEGSSRLTWSRRSFGRRAAVGGAAAAVSKCGGNGRRLGERVARGGRRRAAEITGTESGRSGEFADELAAENGANHEARRRRGWRAAAAGAVDSENQKNRLKNQIQEQKSKKNAHKLRKITKRFQ
jgi:hypothetical protein